MILGADCVDGHALVGADLRPALGMVGRSSRMRNDLRGSQMTHKMVGAVRALLRDESGQTMMEYVTIVVFVVIVMFIAFRMMGPMIRRNVMRASRSIEQ
jgi:Flp pilus assembly pilin Flp